MSTEVVSHSDEDTIRQRQRRLVQVLNTWMAAGDDYDSRVWSMLEEELKQDRVRMRDDNEPRA